MRRSTSLLLFITLWMSAVTVVGGGVLRWLFGGSCTLLSKYHRVLWSLEFRIRSRGVWWWRLLRGGSRWTFQHDNWNLLRGWRLRFVNICFEFSELYYNFLKSEKHFHEKYLILISHTHNGLCFSILGKTMLFLKLFSQIYIFLFGLVLAHSFLPIPGVPLCLTLYNQI